MALNPTEYERIVAKLVGQNLEGLTLDSPPVISHDVKMRGLSGFEHQIDVTFSIELLGMRLLFIVECKHYNKKVGVGDLLTFKARIDDLAAHKGLFVTTVGYQRGAVAIAKQYGIALVLVNGVTWSRISASPSSVDAVRRHYFKTLLGFCSTTSQALPEDLDARAHGTEFFLRRGGSQITFDAWELSIGIAKNLCAYAPDTEMALTISEELAVPPKVILKVLASQELCALVRSING